MSEVGEKVAQATRQRAAVYAHLFLVLRKRLGEREAVDLMSEAIYNFGREKSTRNYSERARSGDLAQAAREFASPDPVKQHQFAPRVVSLTPARRYWRCRSAPWSTSGGRWGYRTRMWRRSAASLTPSTSVRGKGRCAARSASREPAGRGRTSASSA